MRWYLALALAGACGDGKQNPDAAVDATDAPPDADPLNPPTLLDTGLCLDASCSQIAPGIKPYKPRFELYSDGATKRRWIYLPPGTQIDTSDMDYWQFPVGTKVWKEFTRDGVRVETRLVMRIGPGDTMADWFYVAYVWNATQDATTAEPYGVPDANGTPHDVPSRQQCRTCHENLKPSRVLGFSAIQLGYDDPVAENLDLAELVSQQLVTNAPPSVYALPGDTTYQQPALGYMHANCGHCHNPSSNVFVNNTPMVLRLTVGSLGSLSTTGAYQTAVNTNGNAIGGLTKIVVPNMPDQSIMIYRFESTNIAERMPALGTEIMDPSGDTILRDWIMHL